MQTLTQFEPFKCEKKHLAAVAVRLLQRIRLDRRVQLQAVFGHNYTYVWGKHSIVFLYWCIATAL